MMLLCKTLGLLHEPVLYVRLKGIKKDGRVGCRALDLQNEKQKLVFNIHLYNLHAAQKKYPHP